jgi:hypothetical protein
MADPIKFKVSSTVAVFVRPGVSADKKLAGLESAQSLEPIDRITLLFCLMKDMDAVVKSVAGTAFAELPEEIILQYLDSGEAHPSVMDSLARIHYSKPWVAQALLRNKVLSEPAREYVTGQTVSTPVEPVIASLPEPEIVNEQNVVGSTDDLEGDVSDEEVDESGEEPQEVAEEVDEDEGLYLSKYKVAMIMGISEKIKMALSGDKEWRSILIKDSNKLVSGSVIKNPRITDGEILTILKVGVQNDEIIRLICANKEWTKNYMIRKALIDCPKTPLPNSLRYLASLNEKDIASYAKSKNISSVLSTQAKRLLLAKKR